MKMIEHFNNHFSILPLPYGPPIMWVRLRDDNRVYLITRFTKDEVTLCYEADVFTLGLDALAENFVWFDGSPCGINSN